MALFRDAAAGSTDDGDGIVVWNGPSGSPFGLQFPVRDWLKANGVDGDLVPLDSVVAVRNGLISYSTILLKDGRPYADGDGPAIEARTAPLVVAWVEPAAPSRPEGAP